LGLLEKLHHGRRSVLQHRLWQLQIVAIMPWHKHSYQQREDALLQVHTIHGHAPPLVPTLLSLANARVLHKNTEDVPGNASIVRLVGLRSPSQSPAPERHGMLWHGY
jgi:hypothetical protein